MERKPIQIPSSLNGISTLKDGSLSLSFHTQEVSAEEAVGIMGYRNDFGYLLFKPTAFQEDEIPDTDPDIEDKKTLSERLRNTLYVLHIKKGGTADTFHEFRRKYMESLIEKIKEKVSEYD